jgi:putative aldouronate transport system permease protein
MMMTGESVYFITESKWFIPIYITMNIWKGTGFSAIIYIAALSGIDPTLYESAVIDGANRFQKAWYITLPSIKPTITMLLILGMPALIGVNFEQVLLLYRPITFEVADVVPTYMFRRGLLGGDFGYGTAVGFSFSLLSLALIFTANTISRKFSETSLW